jgi:hypothetical protein
MEPWNLGARMKNAKRLQEEINNEVRLTELQ